MSTNKFFVLMMLLFAAHRGLAQEAVLTSGNTVSGDEGMVSYSIGQPFYTTVSSTDLQMSQGVQQSLLDFVETAVFLRANVFNVLTPNGDGKNDFWVIKDIERYPGSTVKVYDRSGRTVFSQQGYQNNWNGSFKGIPLHEGVYIYVIDFGAGQTPLKGTLTILYKN